jgi:septum formation protein
VNRIVLASSSPARLALLKAAGIFPEVIHPEVDEELLTEQAKEQNPSLSTSQMVQLLAKAKAEAVALMPETKGAFVLGGDSSLEFQGESLGKPHDPEVAIRRWEKLRGNSGVLFSGHWLIDNRSETAIPRGIGEVSSTKVFFAELSDEEIAAYVASGEPLKVAGAFTIDGLGGAFLDRIEGDAHTVIGLSLNVLRRLTLELGAEYTSFWRLSQRF